MKIYTYDTGETILDVSEEIGRPMREKLHATLTHPNDDAVHGQDVPLAKADTGDKKGHEFHGNQYSEGKGDKKKEDKQPGYWGDYEPSNYHGSSHHYAPDENLSPEEQQHLFGKHKQLDLGLPPVGGYKNPMKPIEALPDLGTKYLKGKPSPTFGGVNGVMFSKPPKKFWKDDLTPPFPDEPEEIKATEYTEEVVKQDSETGEEYTQTKTFKKAISSGAVLREPDGRIWLVEPKNHYGGYNATFPKGRVEPDLNPRQNALKEIYEESGLQGKLIGYLGDLEGDTTVTRYYIGERIGGDPRYYGDETHSVRLVSPDDALKMLNRDRDKKLVGILQAKLGGETKSEAGAYLTNTEVAAPGNYFDHATNIPKQAEMPYDYGQGTAEPLAAIELVPLGLYFGHVARLAPIRVPLFTQEDPNKTAAAVGMDSFGTDNLLIVSWRPDEQDEEVFTYALLVPGSLQTIGRESFPINPINNIALQDLDDNAIALDCVERLTEEAFRNLEFRNSLPPGWFEALKQFLPQGGRELNVTNGEEGRDGGWSSNP